MLPRINRVTKKKDFEKIFKNSKGFKDDLLLYRAMKNNLDLNRFAFIVSKKVSKKATIRNKLRRRLAEIVADEVKNISPNVQMKAGKDLILTALPGAQKKEFSNLRESVADILIKVKITGNKKNV